MSAAVVMRLGDIEFSVAAGNFEQIDRATQWSVDVPRPLEGLGVPTSRGRESDELTIDGVAFPGFVGDQSSVQRLRDAGDAGAPLLLVDALGTIYGEWLVRSVREQQRYHTADGKPRRMAWTLTLVAVPEQEVL